MNKRVAQKGYSTLFKEDGLGTIENIKIIEDNLKIARNREKSYVDNHRKALEFEVGDKSFLKLSP